MKPLNWLACIIVKYHEMFEKHIATHRALLNVCRKLIRDRRCILEKSLELAKSTSKYQIGGILGYLFT
jgi:hypothetical protein